MYSTTALLPILLLGLQAEVALSIPLSGSGTLHACHVDIQRWNDNSFNLQPYGTSPQNIFDFEIPALSNKQSFTIPRAVGSHNLILNNVASPAPSTGVGGRDFNDPGKLSFSWGDQSWNSYAVGSPCVVYAVGLASGLNGLPDTYTCSFRCDA